MQCFHILLTPESVQYSVGFFSSLRLFHGTVGKQLYVSMFLSQVVAAMVEVASKTTRREVKVVMAVEMKVMVVIMVQIGDRGRGESDGSDGSDGGGDGGGSDGAVGDGCGASGGGGDGVAENHHRSEPSIRRDGYWRPEKTRGKSLHYVPTRMR